MAEREGFEPSVVFSYARFPGVCLKPLSHLSAESGLMCRATRGGAMGFSATVPQVRLRKSLPIMFPALRSATRPRSTCTP
jgi:hypothetical protein